MITQLKQKPYNYGIKRGKPPLNYGMVSNGIKSAPQLCKWHLQDGIITLEAGSIVRWAAGTKAPTLNIGDTYLGYPIVDISWDGVNLIYYTQTQKDYSWTFNTYTGLVQMFLQNLEGAEFWGLQTDMIQSGNTPPSNSGNRNYYNTDNNTCLHLKDSIQQSFPIMEVYLKAGEGVISIVEVYNTGGKMGSSIWLNKNVTMALCDDLTSDCGLNSVEYTTTNDGFYYFNSTFSRTNSLMQFTLSSKNEPLLFLSSVNLYNSQENNFYQINPPYNITKKICTVGANLMIINGDILSYTPFMPFRAADVQNLPGRIISNFQSLFTDVTIDSNKSYNISLANYLPNDGKLYEVWLNVAATTSAKTGSSVNMYCSSDIFNSNVCLFRQQTQANAGINGGGSAIIPVGISRLIQITNTGNNSAVRVSATINGFRRII